MWFARPTKAFDFVWAELSDRVNNVLIRYFGATRQTVAILILVGHVGNFLGDAFVPKVGTQRQLQSFWFWHVPRITHTLLKSVDENITS